MQRRCRRDVWLPRLMGVRGGARRRYRALNRTGLVNEIQSLPAAG